ncbi:MAG: hypothetical protein UY34_C0035G0007 [Parcubacteria group bacterium GW2011_GWA2_48_9]|nr:MAG: hypothetical protein UY34_C0035G0007 [Parcubacteria group bacterium GW2011_GWA2_48_9]
MEPGLLTGGLGLVGSNARSALCTLAIFGMHVNVGRVDHFYSPFSYSLPFCFILTKIR